MKAHCINYYNLNMKILLFDLFITIMNSTIIGNFYNIRLCCRSQANSIALETPKWRYNRLPTLRCMKLYQPPKKVMQHLSGLEEKFAFYFIQHVVLAFAFGSYPWALPSKSGDALRV